MELPELPVSLTDEEREAVLKVIDRLLHDLDAAEAQVSPGWYQRFIEGWYRLVRMWFN